MPSPRPRRVRASRSASPPPIAPPPVTPLGAVVRLEAALEMAGPVPRYLAELVLDGDTLFELTVRVPGPSYGRPVASIRLDRADDLAALRALLAWATAQHDARLGAQVLTAVSAPTGAA